MAPGKRTRRKEREATSAARALYFHRAGHWNFACQPAANGEEGKRIRLQELPVDRQAGIRREVDRENGRPNACRRASSSTRSGQERCYRKMRMPEPAFGSEETWRSPR